MAEENETKPDENSTQEPESEPTPEPDSEPEPTVPIPQKPKPALIDYQTEEADIEIEKKEESTKEEG